MGWTIILENEDGDPIRKLQAEFNYHILDELDFDRFTFLKYIDDYGNTTFNRLQIQE